MRRIWSFLNRYLLIIHVCLYSLPLATAVSMIYRFRAVSAGRIVCTMRVNSSSWRVWNRWERWWCRKTISVFERSRWKCWSCYRGWSGSTRKRWALKDLAGTTVAVNWKRNTKDRTRKNNTIREREMHSETNKFFLFFFFLLIKTPRRRRIHYYYTSTSYLSLFLSIYLRFTRYINALLHAWVCMITAKQKF